MKTLTGIPGGASPLPPAGVEPRQHSSRGPAVSGEAQPRADAPPGAGRPTSETSPTAGSDPAGPRGERADGAGEDLVAATDRLEETLDRLPGPQREVHLLFEEQDRSYVVEVRDKRDGHLIQRFPPEKLLNQGIGPADLLGTVIDRRS